MTTILNERVFPTDLLFRNFFEKGTIFESFADKKPNYPVDIKLGEECLCFDIACVGLKKEDIKITTEGNLLKVVYKKPTIESNSSDVEACEYIHKGITRKSFDMGWKISPKFDLTNISAHMEDGLLTLTIPTSEDCLPKTVIIK